MPSSLYSELLAAICAYIPREKAEGILNRQLPKVGKTADTLNKEGLKEMQTWIVGAASLYIPDASQREEFKAKLSAIT